MRRVRYGMVGAVLGGMVVLGGTMLRAEDGQQAAPMAPHAGHHLVVTPRDVPWRPGPKSLPRGAQMAFLEGNPKRVGWFTMRVKFPANYTIPPHWHPADEHVTVLAGTFHMGTGDVVDKRHGTALPPGSFSVMPARVHHFGWTTEETILQVHGMGPWQINYLNPADDPRT